MNTAEQSLVTFLSASFPDVLHIARQYGAMYGLTLPNAVRYAVGLLGDNLPASTRDQILAMVEDAERGPVNALGGVNNMPLILLAALGLFMVLK